jgi:hypothetical protein
MGDLPDLCAQLVERVRRGGKPFEDQYPDDFERQLDLAQDALTPSTATHSSPSSPSYVVLRAVR